MAVRIGISVPKPSRYYSVENFAGAATAVLGEEALRRIMPYIIPYIPATGDLATGASIALKSLIGFGMFYGARRTTGAISDILYGASFGTAVTVVRDIVSFLASKMPATVVPRIAAAPRVTVTPGAAESRALEVATPTF